ncbi:SDR family oxidoreductase [Microbacterium sp. W4I20]|uniref:SDR family oxidoreductase n=1 Tax=Microbacterium sp. W4I20 TaxID=3042262 RepID=UPI002785C73E|nr:SDR family oxidoreductase [Microbacterium sp. W4I20]MDQ0726542.1 uncharacterized protein YbjT (DUF2867 family) [Microbacterium sp. W4I20]
MGKRIVVVGGTGHIGRMLVERLLHRAQAVVVASPSTGVDAASGVGLTEALSGADVVIDVSNSPRVDGDTALEFFTRTTRRLLEAERTAGVQHHLALSIVGADAVVEDGYFAAKHAQEQVIADSGMPSTILRSTQFFEFARSIAEWNTVADTIHLPATTVRPVAAGDVADALAALALEEPAGVLELAGPESMHLGSFVGRVLLSDHDPRYVVEDEGARANGFNIDAARLAPLEIDLTGTTALADWIASMHHALRAERS